MAETEGLPEPNFETTIIAIGLLNNRVDDLHQELGMLRALINTEVRALQDLIIERTPPRTPIVKKSTTGVPL